MENILLTILKFIGYGLAMLAIVFIGANPILLFIVVVGFLIYNYDKKSNEVEKLKREADFAREDALRESEKKSNRRVHGEVARQLRPTSHGLLLIYPLLPKFQTGAGQWSTEEPFVGLVFSFPSSDRAHAVSYKVNVPFWKSALNDENDFGEY